MPPLGWRDEDKKVQREIDKIDRDLVRLWSKAGDHERAQFYKTELADRAEREARCKAAYGDERDLARLVEISRVRDRAGISAWAAAGISADAMGGDARVRHATRKTLYRKFQKAPRLYQRLAAASEDPQVAADREICAELSASLGIKYSRFEK